MIATTLDSRLDSRSPEADDGDPGWASRLVAEDTDAGFSDLGRRAGSGLCLAALYGVALGARHGGKALLVHALGVPLGLLLVGAIGAPSLFVFLSLCRAPVDGRAIASAAARGVGSAGVLLAGLAPAVALFVVTSETESAAAVAVLFGLFLGGGVALGRTTWDVVRQALSGGVASVFGGSAAALGFAVFAVALALRVWTSVLPILGGAS